MSDVLDTAYQSQDLDGNLHWLGDKYARERLDDTYTKEQSDELFRRIDDSYSSNDINDMMMSKADKADVYTKTEIDTQYEELVEATDEEFTTIRSTIIQLRSDTEVHFQNVEDTIGNLGDTYYNKEEVNAIAEELDRTKQNTLVSDGSILLTPQSDGTVEIGTQSGASIIDDSSSAGNRVWSAEKSSTEFSTVDSEISSMSTAQSEVDSTQASNMASLSTAQSEVDSMQASGIASMSTKQSEIDSLQTSELSSLSTAESELGSELSEFKSEVAEDYVTSSSLEITTGSLTVGTLPAGITSARFSYQKWGHIVNISCAVTSATAGAHIIPVSLPWNIRNAGPDSKQWMGYYSGGTELNAEIWFNNDDTATFYSGTSSLYLGSIQLIVD